MWQDIKDTETQKKAIVRIVRIEKERLDLKEKLEISQRGQNEMETLPGGHEARTPASPVLSSSFSLSETVVD